jgi:hypothetical protein
MESDFTFVKNKKDVDKLDPRNMYFPGKARVYPKEFPCFMRFDYVDKVNRSWWDVKVVYIPKKNAKAFIAGFLAKPKSLGIF